MTPGCRSLSAAWLAQASTCALLQLPPWLEDFKAEILAFPAGRHDDQVDALSQFLGWADEKRGLESCAMPIIISRPREFPVCTENFIRID